MGRGAQRDRHEPLCRWRHHRLETLCVVRQLHRPDVGLLRRLRLPGQGQDRAARLSVQPALLAFPDPPPRPLFVAIPAWGRCMPPGTAWPRIAAPPFWPKAMPSLRGCRPANVSDSARGPASSCVKYPCRTAPQGTRSVGGHGRCVSRGLRRCFRRGLLCCGRSVLHSLSTAAGCRSARCPRLPDRWHSASCPRPDGGPR